MVYRALYPAVTCLCMCCSVCVRVHAWVCVCDEERMRACLCVYISVQGMISAGYQNLFCPPPHINEWRVQCAARHTCTWSRKPTNYMRVRKHAHTPTIITKRYAAYRDNDVIECRDRCDRGRAIKPLFFALPHSSERLRSGPHASTPPSARRTCRSRPDARCCRFLSCHPYLTLGEVTLSEGSLAWVFVPGQTSRDSTP